MDGRGDSGSDLERRDQPLLKADFRWKPRSENKELEEKVIISLSLEGG